MPFIFIISSGIVREYKTCLGNESNVWCRIIMPKTYFISYANEDYLVQQMALAKHAKECGEFDEVFSYTSGQITKTKFYQQNKELLDEKKGAGFCAWKHFIILDCLHEMQENDILMYLDSADILAETEGLRNFLLIATMEPNKEIILTAGAYPNRQYTRRDAFLLMDCDLPEYHDDIQVEAGIIVIRNTVRTRLIIEEWGKYCLDRRIVSEDENVFGLPNLPDYKETRYDQSVLSILKKKLNLYAGNEVRYWVRCNVNDPKQ